MEIRLANIKTFLLDNRTVNQTLIKNTFWRIIEIGLDKVAMLILTIYLARFLGATEYGKFSFALSFISLFIIFYDFGLPYIIVREFAKEQGAEEEIHSLISLKILLSLGAILLISLSSLLITKDFAIQKTIIILTGFSLINNFMVLLYAFFQARQRMEYESWAETLRVCLLVIFGFFVLFKYPSIGNLSYSFLFSSLLALICVIFFFNSKLFHLKISWQKTIWGKFMVMAWPIALVNLFWSLYSYVDSVIMGSLGMITETGWYNAAYKIVFVALIPVGLLSGSFFPVLSNFFKHSKEKLQAVWENQMKLMILLSLPLVVGGIALAPRIINSIYGQSFFPAVLPFQILMIMAGFVFIQRPFYDVMIISNQQKNLFWVSFAGAIINVGLNFILIPKYSLYGAAIVSVITQVLILILSFLLTIKHGSVRFLNFKFIFTFGAAAISSILMYFVITRAPIYNSNILFSVLIGSVTYFSALFIFKKMVNLSIIKLTFNQ